MGPRMTPPRGPGGPMGPMGPGGPLYGPMRGPPPGPGPMPPISSLGPGPRPPWPPSPYGQGSPVYGGPGLGPGPGTPILPSPGPQPDQDPLYMMKNVPNNSLGGDAGPGGLPGPAPGPESGPGPGTNGGPDPVALEQMKQSPATAPTTPRDGESQGGMEFNMAAFPPGGGTNNESEAILKIKESMQEEAKRFEKDSDGQSDYFLP